MADRPDRTGAPVAVPEAPCARVVDPALADTLLTGLSRDDRPGGTSAAAATGTTASCTRPAATWGRSCSMARTDGPQSGSTNT